MPAGSAPGPDATGGSVTPDHGQRHGAVRLSRDRAAARGISRLHGGALGCLTLLLLLAIAAAQSERQRLEAGLGDLVSTVRAQAIGASAQPEDGLVDPAQGL